MSPSSLWPLLGAASAFLAPLAAPPSTSVLAPTRAPVDPVDYQTQVRPILSARCFACHGPDEESREAELRLDVRDDATRLRDDSYRVIAPGDAEESELIWRVTDDSDPMPPVETGHRLSDTEVAVLRRWIDEGAEYTPHWSFEPLSAPEVPRFDDEAARTFVQSPIDAFVLRTLRASDLEPSPEADRYTLIRRLSLDLTGLPPTPEEIEAFVNDTSDDAWTTLVDRLLASDAFGERWASVWLDIARYADSAGYGSDPLRQIWRYRDWVIDALNRDLPYDEFTVQQMAGDLLPDATTETRLATAFHRNTLTNTEGGTIDEEFRVIAVKDRINVSMQAWMGLTFGCAQCHTHKFDPITHDEYYSAFALFNQTADSDKGNEFPRIATPSAGQEAALAEFDAKIAEIDQAIERRLDDPAALEPFAKSILAPQDGFRDRNASVEKGRFSTEKSLRIDLDPITEAPVTAIRITAPARERREVQFAEMQLRHRPSPSDERKTAYVRVSLPGEKRILSLAEVEVFSDGENLAPGGEATQSSTGYNGPAPLAIDGNTDGIFNAGTTTHTATEADPWWQLTLADAADVDRVRVWLRTDAGLNRRSDGLRIELLDSEKRTITSHQQALTRGEFVDWRIDEGGLVQLSAVRALRDPNGDIQQRWTDGRLDMHAPLIDRSRQPQVVQIEFASAQQGGELEVRWLGGKGPGLTAEGPLDRLLVQVSTSDPAPPLHSIALRKAAARSPADRTEAQRERLARAFAEQDPGGRELRAERARLVKKRSEVKIATTPVLRELPPNQRRPTHVFAKGSYLAPLHKVEPGVPAVFAWGDAPVTNRLEFARWLVHQDNPLTSRVTVNRFWSRLFGQGLVLTEEDFGAQGSLPSHPELLDWLAASFRDGWSQKELLRTIVHSSTYKQSSKVGEELLAKDPDNRLLSRGARFRLPAEAVRDQALSVSGLLSRKMYGPSVFPPQPDGLWQAAFNGQRNWRTDTGEDRWRRGLYVFWRRSTPYPSMMVFDAPSRETCTLRRVETNSPLQAFVTLNDPVYVEAAQAFARRLIALAVHQDGEGEVDADRVRVEHGLFLTLGRPPQARAVEVLLNLLKEQREVFAERLDEAQKLSTDPLGPLPDGLSASEAAAWTVVANVLLNQDAFLTRD